jgi:hypothetical protein
MPDGIMLSVIECIFIGGGIFSLLVIISKNQQNEKIFHFMLINHALYTFFLVGTCVIIF